MVIYLWVFYWYQNCRGTVDFPLLGPHYVVLGVGGPRLKILQRQPDWKACYHPFAKFNFFLLIYLARVSAGMRLCSTRYFSPRVPLRDTPLAQMFLAVSIRSLLALDSSCSCHSILSLNLTGFPEVFGFVSSVSLLLPPHRPLLIKIPFELTRGSSLAKGCLDVITGGQEGQKGSMGDPP